MDHLPTKGHLTAAVKAKDGTVLAVVDPIKLTGPMTADGQVDRLDFHSPSGAVIFRCDLSDTNTSTNAGSGDVTVTLETVEMFTEYLRIKDYCNVQQLFGLIQFTLLKYTTDKGILFNYVYKA